MQHGSKISACTQKLITVPLKLQYKIYVIQHTLRQALRLELVLTWGGMSVCCLFYVQNEEFANVMLKAKNCCTMKMKALWSFKMSVTLAK
jgi:hypothetical protein